MPVVPFIPLIASGVGAVGSAFAGKKMQAAAQQRSPEEAAALTGAQAGAGTLATSGTQQLEEGANTQRPATSYFDTLLRGNRAQQAQATAAPRAAIGDVYAGAQRNLDQQGIRGAAKDVASADLNKGRASQISSLVTGVQPGAASALTSIGQTQQAQGAGQIASSNSVYSNLLGQGNLNRQYARGEGEKGGKALGGLVFDLLSGGAKAAGKGSSSWAPQADYNYGGGG